LELPGEQIEIAPPAGAEEAADRVAENISTVGLDLRLGRRVEPGVCDAFLYSTK